MLKSAAAVAVLLVAAAPLGAQAQSAGADPAFSATTLSLSAYGETRTAPDMATLALGVDTAGATAAAALGSNATRMAAVVSALKAAGIEGRDLQTSELNLAPQYAYEQNQSPRLTGYQASNQLTVTVKDLPRLGATVDAAVAAGATNVGQISFGLANPVASENTARIAAVKALDDKAALYAQATGYHIGRLVSLSEGGGYRPEPVRPMVMAAKAQAERTPVEAGEMKVRVDITGLFELAK